VLEIRMLNTILVHKACMSAFGAAPYRRKT
jgi:hypothetical protein